MAHAAHDRGRSRRLTGADDYLDNTRHIWRALVALRLEYHSPATTTWRLPVSGEDDSGIWARRYWET